ncbi:MAG: flavin reductase [Sphingobacteriales bacterium]|nr:MAG: flavin reductase [Sphingobacteriales bacterium]
MLHFSLAQLQQQERFYRANLINSLSGFKPASLIGTQNKEGQTNLAIFSNIVHLGADPALIGFVNRPRPATPHTLANIEATGIYTINHVTNTIIEKAHQTSAKYAADENEFTATALTPEWHTTINAPFVKESTVQYALQLVEIIPIKHNQTFFVIGSVTDVFIKDDQLLQADGFLQLEKAGIIASLGIDGYYNTTFIQRMEYAKKGKPPEKLS